MLIACLKGATAGAVNTTLGLVAGAHWPSAGALAASLSVGFAGYGLSLVLFRRASFVGHGKNRCLLFRGTTIGNVRLAGYLAGSAGMDFLGRNLTDDREGVDASARAA